MKAPNPIDLTETEESFVNLKIQTILRKNFQPNVGIFSISIPIFLVVKKDSGYRTVINLKNLNQNIPHIYFRIGGLSLVKKPIQKGEFLCKLDVKDVYFSVALHKISQKYDRFPWWGSFYGFLCLCFDLEPGPRISS